MTLGFGSTDGTHRGGLFWVKFLPFGNAFNRKSPQKVIGELASPK